VEGQIGLEKTPAEFVARMVEVFREVRRVLRSDGTCWVNLGDSYAAGHGGSTTAGNYVPKVSRHRDAEPKERQELPNAPAGWAERDVTPKRIIAGLKPKDLCGIPWRVAFALQDDGWWLRQDIIWAKPNPMPESVTDRCTKAHEYVFLLTKAARYFYDAEAVKEPASHGVPNSPASIASPYGEGFTRRAKEPEPAGVQHKQHAMGANLSGRLGSNDDWGSRNKRSVWTIATNPFPEAHFATFPPELPEICIKAGCPKGGTVLDPFGGAGTTGLVADRLQRNAVLIELNPEYAAMAQRRINGDRGGLLDVMEAAE
jgi:DNA modification methylase